MSAGRWEVWHPIHSGTGCDDTRPSNAKPFNGCARCTALLMDKGERLDRVKFHVREAVYKNTKAGRRVLAALDKP